MVRLDPLGIYLLVDDFTDLLKQAMDYLFINLEVNPNINDRFYGDITDLLKSVHALRMPIPYEDVEIEIIKDDSVLSIKVYYMEDGIDDDKAIDNHHVIDVQLDTLLT